MRLDWPRRPRKEENLVPLINIVFLILIFFLIASTIKPYSDRQIKLAETEVPSNSAASARMLIITSDGARFIAGKPLSDDDLRARLAEWSKKSDLPITIVADRSIKADQLIVLVTLASAAGIKNVKLLTRRVR